MTQTGLADLAAWAAARVPRLIDEAVETVLERVPLYRQESPVPVSELRRSVEDNLRFLVTAIGQPEAPLDLRAPQETGRVRAHQGAPLPEVLQAYRLTFATLWNALVKHARSHRAGSVDALLTASTVLWSLTDEHALAITEAYREATAELLLADQRRRSALVEALLTGGPEPKNRDGDEAGPWEAARLLGIPPDGQLLVVAAETRGRAEESLPRIEHRLAERGIVSGWQLRPAQQLGVISFHDDQFDAVQSTLREAATARTGISPPYQHLTDTPRALQLARAARAIVPAGKAEVHSFSPSPLAALVVHEPHEGRRLAQQILGPALRLPPEDRTVLLDTLNAYFDHDGSAEKSGEVLFCHPNTVRYRLRRLQELTGRSLSDPHGNAELVAAAYALRLASATGLWRPDPEPGTDGNTEGVPGRANPLHAASDAERYPELRGPK